MRCAPLKVLNPDFKILYYVAINLIICAMTHINTQRDTHTSTVLSELASLFGYFLFLFVFFSLTHLIFLGGSNYYYMFMNSLIKDSFFLIFYTHTHLVDSISYFKFLFIYITSLIAVIKNVTWMSGPSTTSKICLQVALTP